MSNAYDNAPTLGYETTVAIALVDTTVAPAVTGIPVLSGDYIDLGCTQTIGITQPGQPGIPIPCGIEPANWIVPGRKVQGDLSVEDLDFSDFSQNLQSFSGQRTVARIRSTRGAEVLRTIYCIEWVPTIQISIPEGDEPATVSAEGLFSRLMTTVP